MEKFKEQGIRGQAFLEDLTAENALTKIPVKYDFVYSVGLVEHFRGENIKKLIAAHFNACKDGGIVLISVPTPTVQYRIIRKIMETLRAWDFPDEKPLRYEEIAPTMEKYGEILACKVNRKLPLTQLLLVARKPAQETR